jgi:hypothetical protein
MITIIFIFPWTLTQVVKVGLVGVDVGFKTHEANTCPSELSCDFDYKSLRTET